MMITTSSTSDPESSTPFPQQAARRLEGDHNFQHFCRIDSSKPNMTFVRRVLSFKVRLASGEDGEGAGGRYESWMLDIEATAFLWHQVRGPSSVILQTQLSTLNSTSCTSFPNPELSTMNTES